jgi:hypothetical protein
MRANARRMECKGTEGLSVNCNANAHACPLDTSNQHLRRRVNPPRHAAMQSPCRTGKIPASTMPDTGQVRTSMQNITRVTQWHTAERTDSIISLLYQKTPASPPSLIHSIPLRPRWLTGQTTASQPTKPSQAWNNLPSPQAVAAGSSMLSPPEKRSFFNDFLLVRHRPRVPGIFSLCLQTGATSGRQGEKLAQRWREHGRVARCSLLL